MGQLNQYPAPGGHTIHFRGDRITFTLENRTGRRGRAWLRSNIGYAHVRHMEIIRHAEAGLPPLSRDWHDYPMHPETDSRFSITLPLLGVGRFEAKAYFMAEDDDRILWPEGANSVLKVEPAETRAGNTMYTAFVRQFGEARSRGAVAPEHAEAIGLLDAAGYAVIPRAGRFRDLIAELDFIVGHLRCRIVQLLPIHPVPTTYGRMGRFGSAFAPLDLFDVDASHAEFDKLTTPLEQFQELVDEVHRRNARLFMDMPINHTGWASRLQNRHPDWFERTPEGKFKSPGAWGVEWADLVELDHSHRSLWACMAEVFLFWCRRGVDGYRCDAGYMVPFEAWEYIIAKVRMEYPDTVFMLEGLGGYRHVTERLLADSGMNWAYSEIFQNYDRGQVDAYLPESLRVSETKGNLIHFAETHDNARLAATSPAFARLRVAFCALTSHNGAFGFANGVEWYATEQINVHNARSLNWGAEPNMIDWIRRIHAILETHPSFDAGAAVRLITCKEHNAVALLRTDAAGASRLLVLANLNADQASPVEWEGEFSAFRTDLLSGRTIDHNGRSCALEAGEVLCLSDDPQWVEKSDRLLATPYCGTEAGEAQRLRAKVLEIRQAVQGRSADDVTESAAALSADPAGCCAALAGGAPVVTTWQWPRDARRTVLLPPDHCLLVRTPCACIAELKLSDGSTLAHEKSLPQEDGGGFALFLPLETPEAHRTLTLKLTVFEADAIRHSESPVLQLCAMEHARVVSTCRAGEHHDRDHYAICTNSRGALSQIRIGWAELRSKYDGLLAANLHPAVPVDRHMLFTRCRGWIVRKGYSTELSLHCQKRFSVGDDGSVVWNFAVPVGEGLLIPLRVSLRLHPDANALRLDFVREAAGDDPEHLPDALPVALILRPDIEDRCNHEVTKAHAGPEHRWPGCIEAADDGFGFRPAADRALRLTLPNGRFHPEPEWHYMIDHPVDRERGMDGSSDLFSPGYFLIELHGSETAKLDASAHSQPVTFDDAVPTAGGPPLPLDEAMRQAMKAFIVRRDEYRTVIAGYPWFLDWGRDTLICLRGIIAAGMTEEAENILLQFARFEKNGTIPNMIRGNDDLNRETSDAPLWFFVACSELTEAQGGRALLKRDCGGRPLKSVLISLAEGLIRGTENGICMDPDSGLIFSPPHFTWMDTNYPAGTPREGYPIEIQALWHYALTLLGTIDRDTRWHELADRVRQSIRDLFVVEADDFTYLADVLAAAPGIGAADAEVDDALRSNQLLAVTLGAVTAPDLCRHIVRACEQLLVPGAIRSLADRPVKRPAPVQHNGRLLNDPLHPYWGQYTGDEDTRRKPAYHNGTAWTWPFPSYAEALVMVYGDPARETALALLGSASEVINHNCMRQVPEVIDGDTPHTQRGCGAQAWGVTELYRVIRLLRQP